MILAAGAGRGVCPLAPLCSLEGFGLRHLRDRANRTLPHNCPWGKRYRGMSNHIPKGRKVWSLSSRDLLKPRSVVQVSVATGVNRCNLFAFGAEGIDPLCLPPSLCDARCLKCVQVVPVPGRVAAELSPGSAGCCWKYTIHSQLKEGGEKKKSQTKPSKQLLSSPGRQALSMHAGQQKAWQEQCPDTFSLAWGPSSTRAVCRGCPHGVFCPWEVAVAPGCPAGSNVSGAAFPAQWVVGAAAQLSSSRQLCSDH